MCDGHRQHLLKTHEFLEKKKKQLKNKRLIQIYTVHIQCMHINVCLKACVSCVRDKTWAAQAGVYFQNSQMMRIQTETAQAKDAGLMSS